MKILLVLALTLTGCTAEQASNGISAFSTGYAQSQAYEAARPVVIVQQPAQQWARPLDGRPWIQTARGPAVAGQPWIY